MNIVTVHHVKKYFGKGENQVKALDGIDLEIEKGKFTVIIGASGSGKTTLLNMIGGMDIPDEGEVIVDGVNLQGLKEKERQDENDLIFYEEPEYSGSVVLEPGDLIVVAPEDAHKPRLQVNEPCAVKKVVVKVAV